MRRKIFDNLNHAYFVTFSCYRRRRLLDSDQAKGIVVYFLAAQLKRQKGRCYGYVIMPDHAHAMIAFSESGSLSVFMNQWKRRSSIQLKKLFQKELIAYGKQIGAKDPRWQAKYYCFNIYTEKKAGEKLLYMHHNPVKAGLVDKPEEWLFGSARYYLLNKSVGVPIEKVV